VLRTPSEPAISIPSEPSSTNFKYWVIASIIFIILIIIISLGLILFKKQKRKSDKQNLLLTEVVTVKPETLPGTAASPEQVPPAPKPTLLPSSTPASPIPQPTIAATPTPIFAKTTQEHQPPEPMAKELPALPPVQDQDTISEPGKTASEDIDTHKP
jgi:type IV secretory pathway VirB10-like protein